MFNPVLQFLGSPPESSGHVTDAVLVFRNAHYAGWAFLLAVVLTIGVIWSYRQSGESIRTWRKYTLAGLRALLICVLLLLLLQPILRITTEGSVRRAMVFLMDATASMKIEDPRSDDPDVKRAAIALDLLDPAKGLEQTLNRTSGSPDVSHPSRTQLIQAVLGNSRMGLLNRLGATYDLRAYAMGQTVTDLTSATKQSADASKPAPAADANAWINRLTSDSPVTPLGDDLREILSRSRGQPLAGIFVATDGQSNTGSAPLAAAELAKAEGVPLYLYGVGLSNPKDIVVSSVFAQEICFIKDQVPVTIRLRGVGLEGQTGKVVLKVGDEKVDEKDVSFDGTEQVVGMKFTPDKAGEFDVTASIDPRADEAVKDNNSASQHIKVIDGKIKVLVVDTSPRWEFKYLQAMLLRDRRVDAKFIVQEADPAVSAFEGSPFLKAFPTEKQALFDKFDLIILGDVDAKSFSSQQVENIGDFVSKFGGGLLVVPGKRFGLDGLRGTIIEKMLPVELARQNGLGSANESAAADKPVKLELTAAGQRSPMLRLSDEEEESQRLWAKLPPLYWEAPVDRAKPAAEVLLVDADSAKSSHPGSKLPVIALQQYGLGQVLYVGTDNTWRWRKNVGDKFYSMLWGQMMQRLALPHLLGESKRTQLSTDKKVYSTGDRITLYARLYDEGFAPRTDPKVEGFYAVNGSTTPVQLRPLPDQPGMFRGEFVATTPGSYNFHVAGDDKTKLDFTVTEPRLELGETAMNEAVLKEMAQTSGGAFFHEEDLYKLPDLVGSKAEVVRSTLEIDLWSGWFVFAVIVTIAAAEWILRKMSQLK